MGKMAKMITLILIFVFLITFQGRVFANDKGVGMVLETRGKVTVNGKKAMMMQPIFTDSKIVTGEKGKLCFVCYIDNKEYTVAPGSEVIINAKTITAKKGSVSTDSGGKSIPLPKNTVLISRKISGEIFRIDEGDLRIINPKSGMYLSSDDVNFKWEGSTDLYKVLLTEKDSRKKIEGFPKDTNSMELQQRLEYGKTYKFTVQEKEDELDVSGKQVQSVFHILPKEKALKVIEVQRKYEEILKDGKTDKRKACLLMIDYYKENKMYYQAIEILEQLEKSDKDNPYIYYYLADLYTKLGKKNHAIMMMNKGKELDK